jgi:CBS domain-containing protein
MKVADIMTASVASCAPDTPLSQVAERMCENDCGSIPVLDAQRRPAGIVTDRDIVCRAVAQGGDARQMEARQIMSQPVITVSPETSLEECCEVLEKNQLRRVLVVDGQGACCGIVAQADIAQNASKKDTGEVVRAVSKSTPGRVLSGAAPGY